MRFAQFVRTLGLLLVFGLVGSVGGCAGGSAAPVDQDREKQIRESKKTAHRQVAEDAQRAKNEAKQQGALSRKAGRRGQGGG